MTWTQAQAKLGKLQRVTTDRGATPAEALVAADKARRLADDLAAGGVLAGIARHRIGAGDGDAPGVHCTIV